MLTATQPACFALLEDRRARKADNGRWWGLLRLKKRLQTLQMLFSARKDACEEHRRRLCCCYLPKSGTLGQRCPRTPPSGIIPGTEFHQLGWVLPSRDCEFMLCGETYMRQTFPGYFSYYRVLRVMGTVGVVRPENQSRLRK